MAYVYADIDALGAYQQQLMQTVPALEAQAGGKEELIQNTTTAIRNAIERAKEAERAAYAALRAAEEQLREAERQTREYNSNLGEDQEPMTIPEFYYEEVSEREQEYSYAQMALTNAENTLSNFQEYVRTYEQQQADNLEHFKKLIDKSGKFFYSYIQKLVEAKKCTAVSDGAASKGGGAGRSSGAGDVVSGMDAQVLSVKESGKRWTEALPSNQCAALSAYTGWAYVNINAVLRGLNPSFQEGYREKAILIHQALSVSRIPQDCTVYRGASAAALGKLQNVPDDQLIGMYFSDSGFMSTSINCEDSFGGEIRLVIQVPSGAKGAYVGYLSQLGHGESEVLFDMGSIMQITKVERKGTDQRVIHARMII